MKNVTSILFLSIIALVFSPACKKEKTYVYEVNDVTVTKQNPNKKSVKSTEEFISIVYSDLFGTNISKNRLAELSVAYAGFGDKKLVEEMIVRNFLNMSGIQIPTKTEMSNDVAIFVKNTYKKLYSREPSEYESWYLEDYIKKNTAVTPEIVYYALLTSNEYRYY